MIWTSWSLAFAIQQGAALLALVVAFLLVFDSGQTYLTVRRRGVRGFSALLAAVDFQNDIFRAVLIQFMLAAGVLDERARAVAMLGSTVTVLATAANRWRVRRAVNGQKRPEKR